MAESGFSIRFWLNFHFNADRRQSDKSSNLRGVTVFPHTKIRFLSLCKKTKHLSLWTKISLSWPRWQFASQLLCDPFQARISLNSFFSKAFSTRAESTRSLHTLNHPRGRAPGKREFWKGGSKHLSSPQTTPLM